MKCHLNALRGALCATIAPSAPLARLLPAACVRAAPGGGKWARRAKFGCRNIGPARSAEAIFEKFSPARRPSAPGKAKKLNRLLRIRGHPLYSQPCHRGLSPCPHGGHGRPPSAAAHCHVITTPSAGSPLPQGQNAGFIHPGRIGARAAP